VVVVNDDHDHHQHQEVVDTLHDHGNVMNVDFDLVPSWLWRDG
jgi:hypothetical protein